MNKTVRIFPILVLLLLISLIGCFIVSFLILPETNVLPIYKFYSKIYSGIIIFIDLFPVIQIGTFLLGFSLLFGKIDDENHQSRSSAMLTYLKGIFVICIITIGFYITLTEAVKPILETKLEKQKLYTKFFYENKEDSEKLINSKNRDKLKKAENYIKKAIAIYPDSREAKELLDAIKLRQEELKETKPVIKDKTVKTDNLNSSEIMNLANKAMQNHDYFSAHYYASQVANLLITDTKLTESAKELERSTWQLIQNGDNTLEEEERKLYAKKKIAYGQFKNGQILKAYTNFYNIQYDIEHNNKNQSDFQVTHFLNVIRKKLTSQVYFTDEVENIPAFINGKNIEFEIHQNKKAMFRIFAEGVAFGSGKKHEIYLKNAIITKFTYAGNTQWKVKLKYARLIPDISENNQDIITLQMTGVNPNRKEPDIVPKLVIGNITGNETLSQMLPISFSEFLLIKSANNLQTMHLASLFKLTQKSDKFGLKKTKVITELLTRISEFLLLFILSLASCTTAWRYHLSTDDRFKTSWILGFPLFFLLAQLFVDTSRFIAALTAKLYSLTFGNFAITLYIITWIFLLIFSSTRFYLQYKK